MAYANSYKVTVHTKGGNDFVFDDSVNAGAGYGADQALTEKQDIRGKVTTESGGETTTNEVVIPYNAVDSAIVEFGRTTVEKPADPMCQ